MGQEGGLVDKVFNTEQSLGPIVQLVHAVQEDLSLVLGAGRQSCNHWSAAFDECTNEQGDLAFCWSKEERAKAGGSALVPAHLWTRTPHILRSARRTA